MDDQRDSPDTDSADRAGPQSRLLRRYYGGSPTRGRTTDAVADALREGILDGVLAPSAWLREEELAATFEVSRTPVREALRRLGDEGLVMRTAHHGTVVAPLSFEDVLALYVIREDLEGLVARLAAVRRPVGLVDQLSEVQDRMRRTAGTNDPARLSQQNLEFHRLLRGAAGNIYLERFLTQVEHAVRRLPTSTFAQVGRPEEVIAEHDAIVRAVAEGDGETAKVAAQLHMRRARDIRLATLHVRAAPRR